jgi:hypothetical protein
MNLRCSGVGVRSRVEPEELAPGLAERAPLARGIRVSAPDATTKVTAGKLEALELEVNELATALPDFLHALRERLRDVRVNGRLRTPHPRRNFALRQALDAKLECA